ncbi:hypothetical protein N9D31_00890 [Oligoflexaceae bacterium]|nr:hypothetical protein [Oligoflexaceae bacterium]
MKTCFITLVSLALFWSCTATKKSETEGGDGSTSAPTSSAGGGDENVSLTAPANFSDSLRSTSLTATPVITWEAVTGANSYEIAVGTSAGAIDILDWTDVGDVTSKSLTAALPNGVMLYASIKAVASTVKSEPAEGDGWQNLRCPTAADPEGQYIKMFGNETAGLGGRHYDHGTKTLLDWTGANAGNSWTPTNTERSISDYCIAKYEMKLAHDDEGGDGVVDDPQTSIPGTYDWETDHATPAEKAKYKPVSVPQALPWVEIKTGLFGTIGAAQACENLGEGFRLINNAQWQAVARDIEATAENWYDGGTGGDASDDYINRGNSDGIAMLGDADPTDADPCIGTGNASCLTKSHADFTQKRTHSLSNSDSGGDVWDLGGNAYEWVSDLNHRVDGHGAAGADADAYQVGAPYIGDNALDLAEFKLQWGPLSDYSGIPTGSGERGGLGYFFDDNTPGGGVDPAFPGAVIRGGRWSVATAAGPFSAYLASAPSTPAATFSFRCVLAP